MRFENRTLGVFEVLGVHLDADQSFDAGRLRQETLRLVEKGSRRIVVDLGAIDYLYSDSINAFVALNRRLLESSGRLGILVPHPKVHEILVRAGLENIMRLYRTEAELMGDSRELMRQSSAWTRPVELLNEASASQILSANNLLSRSGDAGRDGVSSSQRIPRRRTGPRAELKSRRHDGRRMDQPSEEMPLPPALPGVGSESATLRNLSLDSSTFGLVTSATNEEWKTKPSAPAPKPVPPVLPSAEPTVFQLPQDPEQDGYSTDAWLLALTSQPLLSGQRPDAEQDSSGFLPKLGTEESLASVTSDDLPSQIDTNLKWEEERPHAGDPKPVAPAPPSKPAPSGTAGGISSIDNDALRKAIFHEIPATPLTPGRVSPGPVPPPSGTRDQDAGAPTLVIPTMAPPKDVRGSTPFPVGPAATRPAATEPKAGASADDWFGSAKRSQSPPAPPIALPPVPPKPVVAESKPATSADDWFGSSKRSAPSIPSTPPPVVAKPATVDPKVATPVDDWFGSVRRSAAASPQTPPAPPIPPAASPKSAASELKSAEPALETKVNSPAEDWFTQPAPRVMAPVRDRPVETDEWFGKQAATPSAKPSAPAIDPRAKPEPTVRAPKVAADPSPAGGDDWFRKPSAPSAVPPPPHASRNAPRKADSSFLDSDDIDGSSPKRRGLGFWIAVLVGGLLILGGIAVLVVGLSNRRASDVPPVTAPASEIPAVEPSSQNPSTSAPESEHDADKAKAEETARTKSLQHKPAQASAPSAASAPAPPPEEEHAPVKVFVTSRPSGAGLSLDGKSVGTTPCEITVKRNGGLDFTLAGYRTFHQAIDPDEIHGTLSVQLLSDGGGGSSGRIYISSSPSGADIQLGGKSLGKTPKLVDLPTGPQKVTVKSGVQSQTKTLDIQSGTNPSENFSL